MRNLTEEEEQLRDAAALVAMLRIYDPEFEAQNRAGYMEYVAREAYDLAEAMVMERRKRTAP